MESKRIPIKCKGSGRMQIDELKKFQGALKTLEEKEYLKLRASIVEMGFIDPVKVWKNNILDGHQRLYTVGRMLEDGYTISYIPIVQIMARTKKEAKKAVLVYDSSYGKRTHKSVFDYMKENKIDLKDMKKTMSLSDFDEKYFEDRFFKSLDRTMKPEVDFSEELKEESNYVVLVVDNEVDWLQVQTVLGLKQKQAKHSKKGYQVIGVGRVLKWADVYKKIKGGK